MRLEPPRWWYGGGTPLAAWALWPVSAVYGAIAERRFRKAEPYRSDLPVLCVGNFTMGGAGKTPVALKLANLLRSVGRQPAFLTRGYGGSERGPYLIDGDADGAKRVGDEPLLLVRAAPTVLSRDRRAGARFIEGMGTGRSELLPEDASVARASLPTQHDGPAALKTAHVSVHAAPLASMPQVGARSAIPAHAAHDSAAPDIIIMDDGFQNPSLVKDFCLVVVDGGVGIGNARVSPMGPLRAPLDAQLSRADAIVVLGGAAASPFPGDERLKRAGVPVFRAEIVPLINDALRAQPVLAFCGIGRPGKFFDTLSGAGVAVAEARAFPDHHPFTEADARGLLAGARALGARLVTTEKDRARLKGGAGALAELYEAAEALPIDVRFEAEDEAALLTAIARSTPRRGA
ncbi:tetraacyldisaccharide 4'-kinase [Rhodomicrobium udaipurense JA643]|uniref:Tetraacyldisaccharide 4'-kinase n=1 Tax=Rhodomicrobium udaipurense TaxID=1202716 RepID=A0A8I1GE75_9HYPH|nr:tetraacyldisaccharide 4'-kinase [Rhodomicrobium udaipurense]KAI94658.1 tetraacyldisaccharide 4'-kinase [Rhodomicrobium udaipurense JA643]MBJ7543319.1 tetraacyldisaccharide 4'-kinase [Rhodomicrobium udaipurense]